MGYTGSSIDVTERKRSEEALLSYDSQVDWEQELERAWIARELHDNIGERVGLLVFNYSRTPTKPPLKLFEVQDRIGELEKEASEIATDIQTLSQQLHSAKLDYLA